MGEMYKCFYITQPKIRSIECTSISDRVSVFEIKDVKVFNNKVTIVYFADGTSTKAVLCDGDTFSLETGITICLAKKLFSILNANHGDAEYNKFVKHCVMIYNDGLKAEEQEKAQKEANKEKARIAKEKKDARDFANRERLIEIQKEAYLRALREFNKKD